MANSVQLNGQVLHGSDRFGSWRTHAVTGWDQTPPEKTNDTAREGANGDHDLDAYYGARTITLNGRLSAADPYQAKLARRRLTALLQTRGTLVIDDGTGALWATVKRGNIEPGNVRGRYLTWQMELRAPDPEKFGATHSLFLPHNEMTWLQHYGTFPAAPVLNLTGASATSGYEIRGPGGTVYKVTAPLVAGRAHRVDMKTGRLYIDGALTHGAVTRADTFRIAPGATGSNVRVVALTGSVIATVDLVDTYI